MKFLIFTKFLILRLANFFLLWDVNILSITWTLKYSSKRLQHEMNVVYDQHVSYKKALILYNWHIWLIGRSVNFPNGWLLKKNKTTVISLFVFLSDKWHPMAMPSAGFIPLLQSFCRTDSYYQKNGYLYYPNAR